MANTKVTKSLKGKPITTITTYGNYKGPFPVCTRSNSKVSLVGHKSGARAGGGGLWKGEGSVPLTADVEGYTYEGSELAGCGARGACWTGE